MHGTGAKLSQHQKNDKRREKNLHPHTFSF